MKNKYLILIFLIASLLIIFGALFKIINYQIGSVTGNILLGIGMFLEVLVITTFIIKLISNRNISILNK